MKIVRQVSMYYKKNGTRFEILYIYNDINIIEDEDVLYRGHISTTKLMVFYDK